MSVANHLVTNPGHPFNGVKVLSATTDRSHLGERVSTWISDHPQCKIVEMIVTQSSDAAFHCVAFTIFFWEQPPAKG